MFIQNLSCKAFIITLLLSPILILSSDKYSPISFKADDGIVQVSKKNVPLIGALYERYTHYIEHGLKNGAIPLLPGTSKQEVALINRALNSRPDRFAESFHKLKKEEQKILVNASGLWKKDKENKLVMGLYVPDLIKRFFCTHSIEGNIYQKQIKQFWADSDDEYVLNYCKRQLIYSRRLLSIKESILTSDDCLLENRIDLQSLFINGCCAHKNIYPIPLHINDRLYQTYAYNFVSEFCEYRVTGTPGAPLTYTLWFIDHESENSRIVTKFQHNNPITGCCFSKTKTNIEYIITYSETDIIFSTITTSTDGSITVNPVHVDIQNNGKIATVGYDHHFNYVHVGIYEGINNVVTSWQANGTLMATNQWPFKKYGMLDQIVATKNDYYNSELFYVFTTADMYSVYKFELSNNTWANTRFSGFSSLYNYNHHYAAFCNTITTRNDDTVVYNFWASPFESIENGAKKKKQSSFWQGIKDDMYFEPTDECHKRYSPLGNLLLRHSLKKKLGALYLETEIQDVRTQKPILLLDTLYTNFGAIGFSYDEQQLIFLNYRGLNEKVSLDLSESNKKALETFKNIILSDCGIASLLKHLSIEYDKTGSIEIDQQDPICTMLTELTEHPEIGNLIKICFPINKNSLIIN